MGDESHEGENVYHMLDSKKLEVLGERSYIGPMIDYVRIPFVLTMGYTPIAFRSLVIVVSVFFFVTSAYLLMRYVGKDEALLPLIFLILSPIYYTQQRLAWAVTLMPLFAVLLILVLQSKWKHRYLLAGLIAGLGLANHLLFLATLVPIIAIWLGSFWKKPRELIAIWPIIIGFIAGFGMQFAILQLYPDDQGSQHAIAETFSDRLHAFPSLIPQIVSGSSYIASYTGHELSPGMMLAITVVLSILVLISLTVSRQRKLSWTIFIALIIHLLVLLRIIDRFNLRYSTTSVLAYWFLAGIGLEWIVGTVRHTSKVIAHVLVAGTAVLLISWTCMVVIIPYIQTGGATTIFSLGNRTDSASSLVDTRQLFDCVRGLGAPIYSENVHIYNRLEFWSRQYPAIQVPDEDHKNTAQYIVDYRIPGDSKHDAPGTICPDLLHFRINTRGGTLFP